MRSDQAEKDLIKAVVSLGYPAEFGIVICEQLKTEKMISRMTGYLRNAKPQRQEDIVDEMLAILEERDQWIRKKTAEYNNQKYNEILLHGLDNDEQ